VGSFPTKTRAAALAEAWSGARATADGPRVGCVRLSHAVRGRAPSPPPPAVSGAKDREAGFGAVDRASKLSLSLSFFLSLFLPSTAQVYTRPEEFKHLTDAVLELTEEAKRS
jgi:hypothetical protein